MLKRLMIGLGIVFKMYASEIVDVDKDAQQKLTCKLFSAIVQEGSFEDINQLVIAGADVNANDVIGATPCHHAAVFNRDDVLELFCKHNADINAKDGDGNTPLHYACRYGAYEAAEILLEHGANKWEKNEKKHIAVEYADKFGRSAIVELIKNYPDLEIKEPDID